MGSDLLDIWIEAEERQIVDKYADSVVVIDTSPIRTVDFTLERIERHFLLKVGRAAGSKILAEQKPGPRSGSGDSRQGEKGR